MLGDKIDVKKEIETTLAAKKAEQMVMSLMPAGIIIYLKLTSPGFLGCAVWKSLWYLCYDDMSWDIQLFLLARKKNCRYRV